MRFCFSASGMVFLVHANLAPLGIDLSGTARMHASHHLGFLVPNKDAEN